MNRRTALLAAGGVLLLLLAGSGLHPYDRLTWLLEVFPILIVLPILVATYRRFPLTNLLYALFALLAAQLVASTLASSFVLRSLFVRRRAPSRVRALEPARHALLYAPSRERRHACS